METLVAMKVGKSAEEDISTMQAESCEQDTLLSELRCAQMRANALMQATTEKKKYSEMNALDLDVLQPLIVMCIVTAITPEPNNFIVLTVSIKEGRVQALAPYLEICFGFPLMVFSVSFVGAHVGQSFISDLYFIKYIGAAFLLYIALKLFFTRTNETEITQRSTSFIKMFLFQLVFQWVNPKAWAMAISTLSIVGVENYLLPGIVYFFVVFPCVGVWLISGDYIKRHIIGTSFERLINITMSVLLALSLVFII